MGVGDFTAAIVRHAFFTRERARCFRCRRALRFEDRGIGWSAHHRRPRGAGGTSDPRIGDVSNCLILCGSGTTGCHGWVERFRASAREYGYLVPLNGIETPAGTRVKRQDGSWWLLTRSGLAVEVEKGHDDE
jgi:hypothetical protein